MYSKEEKLWTSEIRSEIILNLKDYLSLYLFKGNVTDSNYGIEHLFDLRPEELKAQKAAHFLLSDKLNEFIKILPFLMRNLAHSTQKEKIECRGIIRGKVDWNQTYKTRYANGFNDKSLFVCMPPSKIYDLEENQLLKYMLKEIVALFENTLTFIENKDSDSEYEELDSNEEEEINDNWQDIVSNRYYLVKKALKNVYFNNISDVNYIKPKVLSKAKRHRNIYYQKLAGLYDLYEKLFIFDDDEEQNVLKELVEKQLLKPASDDTLFELFIFFELVDMLPEPSLGLIMKNNDYSAKSTIGDVDIKIYYQNLPKDEFTNEKSDYKNIFKNYDINVNRRRPDLLLEFEKDEKKYYRIVEVKRTSSKKYIKDSVYKVLGYLNDFEEISFTKNIPGVIVCWGGVKMTDIPNAFDQDILILNKEDFSENILELFYLI